MINRYIGNTGRVQRIPDEQRVPQHAESDFTAQPSIRSIKKPPPKQLGGGVGNSIQNIMRRLSLQQMEQEDLILLLILYLLYRESGDTEFLITLAAFLFL